MSNILNISHNKIACSQCHRMYQQDTMIRNNGICGFCKKKNGTIKEKCRVCHQEFLKSTIDKYNGTCHKCYDHLLSEIKKPCIRCHTEMNGLLYNKQHGICTKCTNSNIGDWFN